MILNYDLRTKNERLRRALAQFIPPGMNPEDVIFLSADDNYPIYLPNKVYVVYPKLPEPVLRHNPAGYFTLAGQYEIRENELAGLRPETSPGRIGYLEVHSLPMPHTEVHEVIENTDSHHRTSFFRLRNGQNSWVPQEGFDTSSLLNTRFRRAEPSLDFEYKRVSILSEGRSNGLYATWKNIIFCEWPLFQLLQVTDYKEIDKESHLDLRLPLFYWEGHRIDVAPEIFFDGLTQALFEAQKHSKRAKELDNLSLVEANLRVGQNINTKLTKQKSSLLRAAAGYQQKLRAAFADLVVIEAKRKAVNQLCDNEKIEAENNRFSSFKEKNLEGGFIIGTKLYCSTKPIELDTGSRLVGLGKFSFQIDLDTANIRFALLEGDREDEGVRAMRSNGYIHPHIQESGNPCLGNVSLMLPNHIADGRITEAVSLVLRFLQSYTPQDAFYRFGREYEEREEDEEYEYEYYCEICDAGTDNANYCDNCSVVFCEECGPSHVEVRNTPNALLPSYLSHLGSSNQEFVACSEDCVMSYLGIYCEGEDCGSPLASVRPPQVRTFQEYVVFLRDSLFDNQIFCPSCLNEKKSGL